MKVIFLDVDGVLNCDTTEEQINGWCFVDNDKIKMVRHIIRKTGAKVVLDSTWRQGYYGRIDKDPNDTSDWGIAEYDALEERCGQFGVHFYSHTKWPETSDRGAEIAAWINAQNQTCDPVTSFVILDDWDLNISSRFADNFVKTAESVGLTQEDMHRAIEILGEKMTEEEFTIDPNIYDIEEIHRNCTVQILRNSYTGAVSIGWWPNDTDENDEDEFDYEI